MLCKLCLEEKELRKSHIIPEFMYARVYDSQPRRFFKVQILDDYVKSRMEQKGEREYLLCGGCEAKLSKYEKYADENLYGKNQNARVVLTNQSVTPDGKVFLYEFEGYDFKKMKLFLDSLLWRVLVCATYETPEYPPELLEKLRLSIYNEEPVRADDFPCLIQAILSGPGELVGKFILSPIEKKRDGRSIVSIFIDGLDYNFYVTGTVPHDEINPFLQTTGEMKIIGRLLRDMPDLIELIRKGMDHVKERF